MRRLMLLLLGPAALAGCPPAPPAPAPVTIVLVNSTGLDVRPNLYVSAAATDAAGLFAPANLVRDFTARPFPELRAQESVTLTRTCDQVRSLGADAPVLFDALALAVTRSQDRVFLLRGADFECGATLRLVYFTEGQAFRVRVERPP